MKTHLPSGSWPSAISADLVAGKSPRYSEPCIHQYESKERIFWLETQAHEKGRVAIMCHEEGNTRCVLPAPLNCRSKVHEYGGGCYCIDGNQLFFVLADDQRIYKADISQEQFIPEALTPEEGGLRFSDLIFDSQHKRIIAVCEDHANEGEPKNTLVSIPIDASLQVDVLAQGEDFYAYPRLDPTGTLLCWISWNHPNMPWGTTKLWLAEINHLGLLENKKHLVPQETASIFQPNWSPDGDLYYVSDINNWWNIYQLPKQELLSNKPTPKAITNLNAEFATPLWVFRMQTYDFLDSETLLTSFTQNGRWQLGKVFLPTKKLEKLDTKFDDISSINANKGSSVFIGANANTASGIIKNIHKTQQLSNSQISINKENLSAPIAVEFPTSEGETAHGFYYPPTHESFDSEESPPMIFICHGGPTGATSTALNLKIQYWTNRGFAVMDVNYRGSTGYGRDYRNRLNKRWGELDVDDMSAAADYAVAQGWTSKDKKIIKGSSAGGYTVLASLCFTNTFNAGVSLYGIGDLCALAEDTHKFEARYLDSLVGDYPEEQDIYIQRSPIHHVDKLSCPILVFQGLEDKVVPPSQAEAIVAAAESKGLPIAYVSFEDEGHGFRNPANIKTMLDAEHSFYCQIFDLQHPENLPKLAIKNLG